MDLDDLKRLIDILKDTDVTDLQIEREGSKVRVRREKFMTSFEMPRVMPAAGEEKAQAAPSPREETQRVVTVTSPLVGTFYSSPSPDAESFVQEGDRVGKGQVICIVEAMKLMNEIESDTDGVIVKTLVENAQPVEYGEPLFLIEPL
jgi:acetyl-CoA carboxylase biotin carboxyl carrier protein